MKDADLNRELRFHIEERVADLVKSGMAEDEARRRVRHEFGGIDQVAEDCRDARPRRWLDLLTKDFKFALRAMRKRPVLSLTMVATVAVCVAINTAVFTVVDSLLIRPLPFAGSDRLVAMGNLYPKAGVTDSDGAAAGDLIDRVPSAVPAVAEQALYRFISHPFDRGGTPVQVRGMSVTTTMFPMLRVTPAEGRLFTAAEGEQGHHRVVILTDGLRRELFGAGKAVGETLRLGGSAYSVIGVLPPAFRFITAEARYFIPIALSPEDRQARHNNSFHYIGRLADGATVEQAQAQVNALNVRVVELTPQYKQLLIDSGFYTKVTSLQPFLMRHVQSSLRLLWLGAVLVLLVGAANLAGLSLARAHAQLPELATRQALGASRLDLIRQSLVEGLTPAIAGGIIGIAAGVWALDWFSHETLPGAASITPSPVVALYALAGALLAGAISGLMSLIPLRPESAAGNSMRSARGSTTRGARLRQAFVLAQTALAFVLLNGAGTLTASIRELLRVDPGFRVEGVQTASTLLPGALYGDPAARRGAMQRTIAALRNLPGVTEAGGSGSLPLSGKLDDNVILAEGYTMKPGESAISPIRVHVTPGFLETLGMPATQGRLFNDRDNAQSQRVIIVDERLARRFWPGQNPVGRRMIYPGDPADAKLTVVGVVRAARLEDLSGNVNQNGVYYVPWDQSGTMSMSLAWRGGPETVALMRQEFARQVPGAALFEVRSMAERQESTLAARRTAQALVLVFAAVAVLLAALGINGLLAFLVSQRQREIGIRLAIGSRPAEIFGLFVREGAVLVTLGLLAGVAAAVASRNWLADQLYGVAPLEPWVLATVAFALMLVSLLAIAVPAQRAARVDPLSALRES